VKVQRPSPGPADVGERPEWAAPPRAVDELTGLVLPTRFPEWKPGSKWKARRDEMMKKDRIN
jgi:hypothetical protein